MKALVSFVLLSFTCYSQTCPVPALRMVDADDTYTYSGVVAVKFSSGSGNWFTVMPNPVINDLALQGYSKKKQQVKTDLSAFARLPTK